MSPLTPPRPRAKMAWNLVLAAAYAAVFAPMAFVLPEPERWLALAAVPVEAGCIVVRWRLPRIALVVSLALAAVLLVAGWSRDPCVAGALVLYAAVVAAPAPGRTALWTSWVVFLGALVALVLLGFGLHGTHFTISRDPVALIVAPSVLAAAWALASTIAFVRERNEKAGPTLGPA